MKPYQILTVFHLYRSLLILTLLALTHRTNIFPDDDFFFLLLLSSAINMPFSSCILLPYIGCESLVRKFKYVYTIFIERDSFELLFF